MYGGGCLTSLGFVFFFFKQMTAFEMRIRDWSSDVCSSDLRQGMSRALTVVQLLPALESGGVERSTLEIADALVRAGHRAIVVSAGGRLAPRLVEAGAEHVALAIGRKSLATLRTVRPLRELLARGGADIVHARSIGRALWRERVRTSL